MRTTPDLITSSPSPRTSPYTHTGIGGAGNIRPLLPPSSLTTFLTRPSPLTTTTTNNSTHSRTTTTATSHSPGRFSTGRGGAGNMPRPGAYRAMFALDEESNVQRRARIAPVTYHTGRGGEGNTVHAGVRRGSLGSDSEGSERGGKDADAEEAKEAREGKRGSLDIAKDWLKRW